MTFPNEDLIAAAIQGAEEVSGPPVTTNSDDKPRLFVESCSPDRTIASLRDILRDTGELFDRGVPVRLTFDQIQGGAAAKIMTPDNLVLLAHIACRPYALKVKQDGSITEVDARLPRPFATMYREWWGNGSYRR